MKFNIGTQESLKNPYVFMYVGIVILLAAVDLRAALLLLPVVTIGYMFLAGRYTIPLSNVIRTWMWNSYVEQDLKKIAQLPQFLIDRFRNGSLKDLFLKHGLTDDFLRELIKINNQGLRDHIEKSINKMFEPAQAKESHPFNHNINFKAGHTDN